jgi:hypothetical protein
MPANVFRLLTESLLARQRQQVLGRLEISAGLKVMHVIAALGGDGHRDAARR